MSERVEKGMGRERKRERERPKSLKLARIFFQELRVQTDQVPHRAGQRQGQLVHKHQKQEMGRNQFNQQQRWASRESVNL